MKREYELIQQFYGNRTAERSKIPLMNHIDEGLAILDRLNAWPATKAAFCLHPMIQDPGDLFRNNARLRHDPKVDRTALRLATGYYTGPGYPGWGYRNHAQAYLCKPHTDDWDLDRIKAEIHFDAMHPQVKKMLIADKIQNQKDFLAAHDGTHPRSKELTKYFENWLKILGV